MATFKRLLSGGLIAFATLVFALACFPGMALADDGGSAGVGAAGTQLVAGSSDLVTQDSLDDAYIAKTVTIQPNKTYNRNFSNYIVHMFKFKSAGGTYKLTVNNQVKSSYMDVWAHTGNLQKSPTFLLTEQPSKGKTTYNLGKIKKGKTVTIQINSGQIASGDKFSFKVTGKGGASAVSNTGKSTTGKSKSAKIALKSSNTKVSVKDAKYTGKAVKPAVTVKYNGKKLKKGADYTLDYSNNKQVGKAKVKVTGKGKYKGSLTATFKVKPLGKVYALVYGAAKGGETTTWTDMDGTTKYIFRNQLSDTNVSMMKKAFSNLKIPGYADPKVKTVNKKSMNRKQFNETLKAAFKGSKDGDLCFVYLNAHSKGIYFSAINEVDYPGLSTGSKWYNYYQWLDMLDSICNYAKGTVVLMPEVCNSGHFIEELEYLDDADGKRVIVLSAASTEMSAVQYNESLPLPKLQINFFGVGLYTSALAKALGVHVNTDHPVPIVKYKKGWATAADNSKYGNSDGKVTLAEVASYVQHDSRIVKSEQSPQVYPKKSSKKLKDFVIYQK